MIVAVDCETTLIPPTGKVRTSHHVPTLVAISAATDTGIGDVWSEDRFPDFWDWLDQHQFPDPVILVFHNAPFDLGVLSRAFPDRSDGLRAAVLAGRVRDTEVLYKLRNPTAERSNLKLIVKQLLNHDLDKGAVRTSFRPGVPLTEEQKRYAFDDAKYTLRVYVKLRETPLGGLVDREYETLLASSGRAYAGRDPDELYSTARALTAWHLHPQGLGVHQETLEKHHKEHELRVSDCLSALVSHGLARVERKPGAEIKSFPFVQECRSRSWEFHQVNQDGTPQLRRRWKGACQAIEGVYALNDNAIRGAYKDFAEQHGLLPKVTTRGVSIEYDFWKLHREKLPQDHPLRIHLDLGKRRKYLSCFLAPPHRCRAERIYPTYVIPGTVTGRWACYGPNLQQLPKALREIYIPSPGHVFISADYKSLELYTLANTMAGMDIRGPLLKALEDEVDIHQMVAGQLGCVRQDAKACNFGLPGGMGARRFHEYATQQMGLQWGLEKSRRMREDWFKLFYDVREYLDRFNVDPYSFCPHDMKTADWLSSLGFDPDATWPSKFELARSLQKGAVYTCALPSGRVVPLRGYSAAANLFFQGTGGEVITEAFIRVAQDGLNPVAVVHDSITCEVREQSAEYGGTALVECMQGALEAVCPLVPAPLPEFEISEVLK